MDAKVQEDDGGDSEAVEKAVEEATEEETQGPDNSFPSI